MRADAMPEATPADDKKAAKVVVVDRPMVDVKVVCAIIGVSRTTIYKWMRKNEFPKGYEMPSGGRRWFRAEIDAWIKSRQSVAA